MNSEATTDKPKSTSKNAAAAPWQEPANLPALAKKDDSKLSQDVFESILWRINGKSASNETVAVGVTGCNKKSGSTTIAARLAKHASDLQRDRVLLIDANWQLPGLLKTFGLSQVPGLYDVLSGELAPRECEPQDVSDHLSVMCRGMWGEQQPAAVRQELVDEMLAELKTEYGLIIVDLPPADGLRSALPLARKLDGSLLVARFEAVKQPQAQRALRRLQEDGVNVWGSILNRHRDYVPKWLQGWL